MSGTFYKPQLTEGIFWEVHEPSLATVWCVETQALDHEVSLQAGLPEALLHELHGLQAGLGPEAAVDPNDVRPCARQ